MGMITIYFPAVCNDSFQMFGQEQWCQISVPFFCKFLCTTVFRMLTVQFHAAVSHDSFQMFLARTRMLDMSVYFWCITVFGQFIR